jgi:hypothetical protein
VTPCQWVIGTRRFEETCCPSSSRGRNIKEQTSLFFFRVSTSEDEDITLSRNVRGKGGGCNSPDEFSEKSGVQLVQKVKGGSNMTGTNCDLFTHK